MCVDTCTIGLHSAMDASKEQASGWRPETHVELGFYGSLVMTRAKDYHELSPFHIIGV